jgi:hypothetical protein
MTLAEQHPADERWSGVLAPTRWAARVMISARGRSRREFEQTRRKVGKQVWYGLYQGSPSHAITDRP